MRLRARLTLGSKLREVIALSAVGQRRGTYRIIYRIDEAKHQVEIHSIRHRRQMQMT